MEKQQNTLLVLGNGFDKSIGLPTSYTDFLASEEFKEVYHNTLRNQPSAGLIQTLQQRASLENWVDVELAIKEFAISNSRDSMSDNHAKKIKTEFVNLRNGLATYLNKIIREYKYNSRNSFVAFSEKMIQKQVDVMSFNYTDVFPFLSEKIQQKFSNIKSITNIHGTLEQENIIFGIDGTDSRDINEKITFLEKEFNINYRPKKAGQLLEQADEIFFFGISLGETDRRYYQPFFDYLFHIKTEKKLYFSFYGDESRQYLHNRIKDYTSNRVHELRTQHEIVFYDCESRKFIE